MRMYDEFHGELEITNIGKRLRQIVKTEKASFKIMTGYGSTGITSKSKQATIKSLNKMKSEGLIKGFIPGEVKYQALKETEMFYYDKIQYQSIIKNDSDYGNEGIIFIFI